MATTLQSNSTNATPFVITEEMLEWQAALRFMLITMAVTMTMALVGNTFLAFVIIRGRSVKSILHINPMQMLLLHNCAADILFALITLLPTFVTMIGVAHSSDLTCKVTKFIQVLPMYASPFLLVAISADRFQAICRPFANLRDDRHKRARVYALVCWLLSVICSSPQLFLFRLHIRYGNECLTDHLPSWLVRVNVIYFSAVAWLVPSSVAAYFYTQVCQTVWNSLGTAYLTDTSGQAEKKRRRRFGTRNHSDVMRALAEGSARTASIVYVEKLRKTRSFQRRIDEQERKKIQTVKLTLTIVSCNFFLWAPFCISNVLFSLFPNLLNHKLTMYIMLFGNLNSCVNPWIFVLFNRPQVKKACCGRGDFHDHSTGTLRTNNTTAHTTCMSMTRNVSRNTLGQRMLESTNKKISSASLLNSLPQPICSKRSGTFAGPYTPKIHEHTTADLEINEQPRIKSKTNGMVMRRENDQDKSDPAHRYMTREISDISIDFIDQETARSSARYREQLEEITEILI